MWILERVGVGGRSEWLGYYVKVWIIEWASKFLREGMSGRVSQWVSDEMPEQSNEQADVYNYGSEWENEEVCELMSYINTWVNMWIIWEGERYRGRERASKLASEFDVRAPKMTTSSMLGRHWTECLLHNLIDKKFLWLETVLSMFSLINYHLPLFIMTSYDIVWFQVLIWFEHPYACTSYVCPFNDNTLLVNIITVH